MSSWLLHFPFDACKMKARHRHHDPQAFPWRADTCHEWWTIAPMANSPRRDVIHPRAPRQIEKAFSPHMLRLYSDLSPSSSASPQLTLSSMSLMLLGAADHGRRPGLWLDLRCSCRFRSCLPSSSQQYRHRGQIPAWPRWWWSEQGCSVNPKDVASIAEKSI